MLINLLGVTVHQKNFQEQAKRKAAVGQPHYANDKFIEEVCELQDEGKKIVTMGTSHDGYLKDLADVDEYLKELADVVFCVLGDPGLAEPFLEKMKFNDSRFQAYKARDKLMAEWPGIRDILRSLKFTPDGWKTRDGGEVPAPLLRLLE